MSLGMMSPIHERWNEFITALAGPDGCNFHEVTAEKQTWECDGTPNFPIARKLLDRFGTTPAEVEQSIGFFRAHGGMCDCEIVFNVEDSFNSMMGRGRRGKNPRRKRGP